MALCAWLTFERDCHGAALATTDDSIVLVYCYTGRQSPSPNSPTAPLPIHAFASQCASPALAARAARSALLGRGLPEAALLILVQPVKPAPLASPRLLRSARQATTVQVGRQMSLWVLDGQGWESSCCVHHAYGMCAGMSKWNIHLYCPHPCRMLAFPCLPLLPNNAPTLPRCPRHCHPHLQSACQAPPHPTAAALKAATGQRQAPAALLARPAGRRLRQGPL